MSKLNIESSAKTPLIKCDDELGRLTIEGRSIPENAVDFFQPLYDWIDEYSKFPKSKTEIDVKLEYFNTSSSKCLLKVLKKLETLNVESKSAVNVNWFFEEDDEDMNEAGQDFDVIISMPFNMVEVAEL